jgi:hypothetical protein
MRGTTSRIACSAALLAVLVLPRAAVGQSKPVQPSRPGTTSSSTAEMSSGEARLRFNEGIALADAGDHDAARLKFNQAWVLLKSPSVLYNLARAEQLSGHLLEALEHFRLFVKMASDPKVTDTQRQRAADNIAELSKKVGQIDVEAPSSARISVDGRPVDGANGDPIPVATGRHVVEALVDGRARSVTVDCQPGTVAKAKLLDDKAGVGTTGPANDHASTNALEGGNDAPKAPNAGPTSTLLTTRNVVGGSLAVAGVLATGLAIGFLVDSNVTASDAKDFTTRIPGGACAQRALASCTEYTARLDDASSSRTISQLAFGAAGLFAIGALVSFTLWPAQKDARAALRPMIKGNTVGLRADF